MNQKWPKEIYIVRHGQSAGNVARDAAEGAGLALIDIDQRDVDVPLSELGAEQATALGKWLEKLPSESAPDVIFASPYERAHQTAQLSVGRSSSVFGHIPIVLDERLREREFGILDRLTKKGIVARFPEQNELRKRLGKFYYRPPGGESWCDVLLRLRAFLETVTRDYSGRRVLIVCHSVVILCFRYLIENLSEQELLAIDRSHEIANCSVTSYSHEDGKLVLKHFNYVAPVAKEGAPVTRKSDVAPT